MSTKIDIILNVYLLGDNRDTKALERTKKLSKMGIGLYHTGIEIQGVEYSYGGNANNGGSGVFTTCPLSIDNATYECSYLLGTASDYKIVYETLNTVR